MPNNTLDAMKAELKNANTMAEFLRICSKYYDFDNAKLGTIAKITLSNNIGTVISISGAKPKK